MSSGRRTNLLANCKCGILFSCISWLRTFLTDVRLLDLFLHGKKLYLHISCLFSPFLLPQNWRLTALLLCLLFGSQPLNLQSCTSYSEAALAWSHMTGWVTLDTKASSTFSENIHPSKQQVKKGKKKKKLLRTWNRWSRPALLHELGQTLLFPNSYSKYTSPTCPFLDGTSLV